jgi:hypothetical protein
MFVQNHAFVLESGPFLSSIWTFSYLKTYSYGDNLLSNSMDPEVDKGTVDILLRSAQALVKGERFIRSEEKPGYCPGLGFSFCAVTA